MKTIIISFVAGLLMISSFTAQSQESTDSTGFAGDNFSLEGAMDLFKNASSIEDFEKQLNNKNNHVNNLDLNNDGDIDYIRVEDHMEDELHAIVLQIQLDKDDIQDIAVIEIEKTGKEEAVAQIIGDEEIFGSQLIVEPFEVEISESDESGPYAQSTMVRIIVNVWIWPSVRYIYAPVYHPWISPWHWNLYPTWWTPWRPFHWHAFHVHKRRHRTHFHITTHHRVKRAHKIYTPRRRKSITVTKRTTVVRTKKVHHNKVVKSKTTKVGVKKSNGKVVAGKKTTTKVGGKNKKGNVVAGKKTTKTKVVKKKKGTTVKKTKKTKTTKVKRGNKTVTKKKTTTKKVRRKR